MHRINFSKDQRHHIMVCITDNPTRSIFIKGNRRTKAGSVKQVFGNRHRRGRGRGAGHPAHLDPGVLHPVRIDDAGAAQGRPAGGQQIPLWLVL